MERGALVCQQSWACPSETRPPWNRALSEGCCSSFGVGQRVERDKTPGSFYLARPRFKYIQHAVCRSLPLTERALNVTAIALTCVSSLMFLLKPPVALISAALLLRKPAQGFAAERINISPLFPSSPLITLARVHFHSCTIIFNEPKLSVWGFSRINAATAGNNTYRHRKSLPLTLTEHCFLHSPGQEVRVVPNCSFQISFTLSPRCLFHFSPAPPESASSVESFSISRPLLAGVE